MNIRIIRSKRVCCICPIVHLLELRIVKYNILLYLLDLSDNMSSAIIPYGTMSSSEDTSDLCSPCTGHIINCFLVPLYCFSAKQITNVNPFLSPTFWRTVFGVLALVWVVFSIMFVRSYIMFLRLFSLHVNTLAPCEESCSSDSHDDVISELQSYLERRSRVPTEFKHLRAESSSDSSIDSLLGTEIESITLSTLTVVLSKDLSGHYQVTPIPPHPSLHWSRIWTAKFLQDSFLVSSTYTFPEFESFPRFSTIDKLFIFCQLLDFNEPSAVAHCVLQNSRKIVNGQIAHNLAIVARRREYTRLGYRKGNYSLSSRLALVAPMVLKLVPQAFAAIIVDKDSSNANSSNFFVLFCALLTIMSHIDFKALLSLIKSASILLSKRTKTYKKNDDIEIGTTFYGNIRPENKAIPLRVVDSTPSGTPLDLDALASSVKGRKFFGATSDDAVAAVKGTVSLIGAISNSNTKFDIFFETITILLTGPGSERHNAIRFIHATATFRSFFRQMRTDKTAVKCTQMLDACAFPLLTNGINAESEDAISDDMFPSWFSDVESIVMGATSTSDAMISEVSTFFTQFAFVSAFYGTGVDFFVEQKITCKEFMATLVETLIINRCGVQSLLDAALSCVRFAYVLKQTGSLSLAYSHARGSDESEFFDVQSIMHTILAPTQTGKVNYFSVRDRITRLQSRFTRKAISSRSADRILLNARVRILLDWKCSVDTKILEFKAKLSPFVITLYGDAGIGKSDSVKRISKYLHKLQGMEDIERIGTSTNDEAYDSNLDADTTAILLDDVGNTKLEYRNVKSVTANIIRLVQPTTTVFTKAEVDLKGKCLNNARFVFITTNKYDADGSRESQSLNSVARRLGLKVELEILPQYKKTTGELDPFLLDRDPNSHYLPYWLTYRVYNIVAAGGASSRKEFISPVMNDEEFLIYLRDKCLHHFTLEEKRMANFTVSSVDHDMCVHSLPTCCCQPCSAQLRVERSIAKLQAESQFTDLFSSSSGPTLTKFETLFMKVFFHICRKTKLAIIIEHRHLIFFSLFVFINSMVAYFCFAVTPLVIASTFIAYKMLDYYMDTALRSLVTRPFNILALRQLEVTKSCLGPLLYLVLTASVTGAVYTLIKKFLAPYLFRRDLVAEDQLQERTVEKVLDRLKNETGNSWAPVIRVNTVATHVSKTSGIGLFNKMKNNMFIASCTRPNGEVVKVTGLVLDSNSVLLPAHIWFSSEGLVEYMDITLCRKANTGLMSWTNRVKPGAGLYLNLDKDFSVVAARYFGSRLDVTGLFCVEAPVGPKVLTMVRLDSDYVYHQDRFDTTVSPITYSTAYPAQKMKIEARTYVPKEKNQPGWCGSLILDSSAGVSIVGIHVAGDSLHNFGCATIISQQDLNLAYDYLRSHKSYLKPSDLTVALDLGGKSLDLAASPHSKNPVNYMLDMVEFIGDAGKVFTPSGSVELNPYGVELGKKMYMYPHYLPLSKKAFNITRAAQPVLYLSGANTVNPDANYLEAAVNDYTYGMEKIISDSLARSDKFLSRPLTLTEAINGIVDNPYFSNIKATTSAGYPFNCQKMMLLEGSEGCFTLKPKYRLEYDEIVFKTFNNQHSGTVFQAQLKDETREPAKVDNARVFFCGPVYALLLMRQYLSPAIAIINGNPGFFETSIGLDIFKPNWHERLVDSYSFGSRCLAMDFKKYDQTQCPSLSIAATTIILSILRNLGYSEIYMKHAETVCNEFLTPIINVNGAFILLNNLHPSGYLLTAHLGGIKGSLALRASFLQSHGLGEGQRFRDLIWLNNLGDDNEAVLHDSVDALKWNPSVITHDLANMGLQITDAADKGGDFKDFVTHQERIFLKRKNWFHPELKRIVGLLDPRSIMRPFHYYTPSQLALPDYMIDIGRNFLKESFAYGREIFERNQKVLIEAYDCNKLPTSEDYYFTYDQRVQSDEWLAAGVSFEAPVAVSTAPLYEFDTTLRLRMESEIIGLITTEQSETIISDAPVDMENLDPIIDKKEAGFDNFFAREVEVFTDNIPVGVGYQRAIYPFASYLRHSDTIKHKLNEFLFWSGTVKLRFALSCSPFHSGAIMITNTPHSSADEIYQISTEEFRNTIYSQRQHVIINMNRNNEVLMEIPFISVDPVALFLTSVMEKLSVVEIHSIVDCHHSNNESPAVLTCYASMPDIKLHGATSIRLEMMLAAKIGAKIGGKVLSKVPGLDKVADASSVIGWGTSLFDKEPAGVQTPTLGPNLSTGTEKTSKKLTLSANQGVLTNAEDILGIMDNDELSYDYLNGLHNLVDIIPWPGDKERGTHLHSINVSPSNVKVDDRWVCLPSQALIANNYRYWRGTMHYEFEVVTAIGNGGKLIVYYDPMCNVNPVDMDITRNQSIMIDLKETYKVHITVHWQSMEAMLFTKRGEFRTRHVSTPGVHNGVLIIKVLAGLSGAGVREPRADILVRQWATDMHYGVEDRGPYARYGMYADDPNWDPTTPYLGPISWIINKRCGDNPDRLTCRAIDSVRKFFKPGPDDDDEDVVQPGDGDNGGGGFFGNLWHTLITPLRATQVAGSTAIMTDERRPIIGRYASENLPAHLNLPPEGLSVPQCPDAGPVVIPMLSGTPACVGATTPVVLQPPFSGAVLPTEPPTRAPRNVPTVAPTVCDPCSTAPVRPPFIEGPPRGIPLPSPVVVPTISGPSASPSGGHAIITEAPQLPTRAPSLRPRTKQPTARPVTSAPVSKAPTNFPFSKPVTLGPAWAMLGNYETDANWLRSNHQPNQCSIIMVVYLQYAGSYTFNVTFGDTNARTLETANPLGNGVSFPTATTMRVVRSGLYVGFNLVRASFFSHNGASVLSYTTHIPGDVDPYFIETPGSVTVTTFTGPQYSATSLASPFQADMSRSGDSVSKFFGAIVDGAAMVGPISSATANPSPVFYTWNLENGETFDGRVTGTAAGAIVGYLVFRRTLRMESELLQTGMVEFVIGEPDRNGDHIQQVHIGESVNSLKALGMRMRLETRVRKPPRENVVEAVLPMYGEYNGAVSYTTLISNSFLAVRGGIITLAHYEGNPATLAMYKPQPTWNDEVDNEDVGFEFTDTSIQPSLTVTFPYQSQKRFETPRVLNQELEDPIYRSVRIVVHPSSDTNSEGNIQIYSSFAPDYSAHVFLGAPILIRL